MGRSKTEWWKVTLNASTKIKEMLESFDKDLKATILKNERQTIMNILRTSKKKVSAKKKNKIESRTKWKVSTIKIQ